MIFLDYSIFVLFLTFSTVLGEDHHAKQYQPNLIDHHNMDSNHKHGQGGHNNGNYQPSFINKQNMPYKFDPEWRCKDYSNRCHEGHDKEFCNRPRALVMCPLTCGRCKKYHAKQYQPNLIDHHNVDSNHKHGQGGHNNGNYQPSFINKQNMHSKFGPDDEYTTIIYHPGAMNHHNANANNIYSQVRHFKGNYLPNIINQHSKVPKVISSPGKSISADERVYMNIEGGRLKVTTPEFELGPSSRDFITKQVDRILSSLNGNSKKTVVIDLKERSNNKNITKAKDCDQLYNQGMISLKHTQIFPYSCCPDKHVSVKCDQVHDGGRWTTILSRGADLNKESQADFEQNWDDYVKGFGKLDIDQDGEYWIGLEAIHELTSGARQELFISLEDHVGNRRWAKYTTFSVDGPETNYKLNIEGYSGDAGDSLKYHNNQPFSTVDKDNDQLGINCAEKYSGGWWFRGCHRSNLNGVHATAPGRPTEKGITWVSFKDYDISLHTVTMKIRPVTIKKADPVAIKKADPVAIKKADPVAIKKADPVAIKKADPVAIKKAV